MSEMETCPDCGVVLPITAVLLPRHRYIGASATCWTLFSALNNGGDPPLASGRLNGLLVDAYAAQHHGTPSPQAIQSVAVHLLVLHGVLVRGESPAQALWIRKRSTRHKSKARHAQYKWLTPPSFAGCVTIADIVAGETAEARTAVLQTYVQQVWERWSAQHGATVAAWYTRYIVG